MAPHEPTQDPHARNTHVERARQIADAIDSPDREGTLYEQFYAEFKAWEAEDPPTHSMRAFDRAIGRGNDYTRMIVRFIAGAERARQTPFGGQSENERKDRGKARTVLADPEQRQRVIESLPAEVKQEIVREVAKDRAAAPAIEQAAVRLHAQRAPEHERITPQERERRHKEADAWAKSQTRPVIDSMTKTAIDLLFAQLLAEIKDVDALSSEEHDRYLARVDEVRTEIEVKYAMRTVV